MTERTVWAIAFLTLVAGVVLGAAFAVSAFGISPPGTGDGPGSQPSEAVTAALDEEPTIERLGTKAAYTEYVNAGDELDRTPTRSALFGVNHRVSTPETVRSDDVDGVETVEEADEAPGYTDSDTGRVAETNVQVAGLDEPDVVKTDGTHFYYSPPFAHAMPRPLEADVPRGDYGPRIEAGQTHVVDVSAADAPEVLGEIDATGDLLLTEETVIVFDRRQGQILGFDVSEAASPEKVWHLPLEDRLVTARELDGQLFVVTKTRSDPSACPISPLGSDAAIDCGDVYAPSVQTSAESTYTAFSIDAESGSVDDSLSFVGGGRNTVVYMSPESIYLTYTTRVDHAEVRVAWAMESDVVPTEVKERLHELDSYDISKRSMHIEIELAFREWLASLPEDERDERMEALMQEYNQYVGAQQENLVRTTVVEMSVDGDELAIGETGTVPGEPLDQFALDAYQGTLRITTTIPRAGSEESYSTLSVLDAGSLDLVDEVSGLGVDQRVYAVRYVDDVAYVVTFRQVDPFYVIDFDDPTEPQLLGELKLPGFSTYLHPIDDDHVLGIGQEDWQVKAVLFDVSDPTEPVVGDDVRFDERFSAIDRSHHAFLIDRVHEVFFLPAENVGHVVDYSDGELDVVAEIEANATVTRARYVDDYLYVFAGSEIIVVDQTTWNRTKTLQVGHSTDRTGDVEVEDGDDVASDTRE